MRLPVRSKGRPSLEQATAIDDAIRKAAIDMLLNHGEGATLNAVAHAAGLSRKTVYARYPGKEALFLQVIRDMLSRAAGVRFDNSGPAEVRLHNYILAALELIATPQACSIQRLMMFNPGYLAALKAEMLAAVHRHFFVPLHDLLHDADARGELAVEDVEMTVRTLLKLIFADSMGRGEAGAGGADGGDAADTWLASGDRAAYARFVTRLVTQGMLPR